MPVTQFEILLAALLPFVFCLALGGPYIRLLQKRYMGQYIREDGPKSHHAKAGTPTAGGVLILGALTFALLAMIAIKGAPVFLTIPVSLVALLFPRRFGPRIAASSWGAALLVHLFGIVYGLGTVM